MLFVFMIVFQLTGALLLLINSVDGRKDKVIKNCFPGSNTVIRDDDNKCLIGKEKIQKSAYNIYQNRAAFLDLVLGYAFSAFNPSRVGASCFIVPIVLIGSIFLVFVENNICRFISTRIYKEDLIIPYESLEKEGIETFATDKEIEDIF